ncbi:MAG: glycosyltransferase family 4 protein [Vicinamibacterales bacterium]
MKIAVVTHYYASHGGGIEIVAWELAMRLAQGADVVWLASDCDGIPAKAPASVRFVPMRSTNRLERLTGLPVPLWSPGALITLWHEVRSADAVHLHDFAYAGNLIAFVAARVHRRPIVITQHVGFIPYRNPIVRAVVSGLQRTLGQIVLARASRVVFVSPVVRNYFAKFVRFRSPPIVLRNGVDTHTFVGCGADGQARARLALGVAATRPVLLFVGRFVEKKGLHLLRRLTERMPDVTWLFAGRGPLHPAAWNRANVRVLDGLSGATLVPLYCAADMLVLPSVGEGLPLVVQESIACGTPVLIGEDTAEAVGGPTELVFSCRVGGAREVDSWEKAIRSALAEIAVRRSRLPLPGPSVPASWEACSAAYAALFNELISPHSPSELASNP